MKTSEAMKHIKINIHTLINLRGARQQSFYFDFHKRKRDIILLYALKNVEINNEIWYERWRLAEHI